MTSHCLITRRDKEKVDWNLALESDSLARNCR